MGRAFSNDSIMFPILIIGLILIIILQQLSMWKRYRPKRKTFDAKRIWEKTDKKDYGIFNPCMTDRAVVEELCSYFLGDDWYDSSGCTSPEQINTEIVCQIEMKYKGAKIINQ